MANLQHRDIVDTEAHEPKNISTATTGQVYAANGSGSGVWKKLNEVDNLDYSNKAKNSFGWNDISDTQYTSGAPRAISSAARTQLTNNGLAAQTDTSRLGALWDSTNSRFLINNLNAFYIINVNFKVTAAAAAGTPYSITIELESANGPTVIRAQSDFIKGGGAINNKSFSFPIYVGSFINNQYLKFFVTPDTNINLYDVGFVLQRTYKET